MKKAFIIGLLLGGIIFGTSVYAVTSYLYEANEVSYTPSDTTWNVSDVKDALNDLHDKAKNYIPAPSGNKQITISSTGTSSAVDVTNYATATCKTSGLYNSCSSCCSCSTTFSVIASGTLTTTGSHTITLPRTISENKYFVKITTGSYDSGFQSTATPGATRYSWGMGAYISSKTSTDFTIVVNGTKEVYYEVISADVLTYGLIKNTSGANSISLPYSLDPSRYTVVINTGSVTNIADSNSAGSVRYGWGMSAWVTSKTSTAVTITTKGKIPTSYEIVKLN